MNETKIDLFVVLEMCYKSTGWRLRNGKYSKSKDSESCRGQKNLIGASLMSALWSSGWDLMFLLQTSQRFDFGMWCPGFCCSWRMLKVWLQPAFHFWNGFCLKILSVPQFSLLLVALQSNSHPFMQLTITVLWTALGEQQTSSLLTFCIATFCSVMVPRTHVWRLPWLNSYCPRPTKHFKVCWWLKMIIKNTALCQE